MRFQTLYKRPYNDHENPFIYVETNPDGSIVEEPWDHGLDRRVTFTAIDIEYRKKGDSKPQLNYRAFDREFSLYVTDSRLILMLKSLKEDLKFNGSLIDLGIDALFKKYEDKQVEGQQIIGQLRYEWLIHIMYFQKTGWKNNNMLKFCYFDSDLTFWKITITFKNDMDVAFLANEILHLSCIYKEYSCDQKSDKLSAFLARNKTGIIPPADDPRNQFASIAFPSAKTACNGQDERPVINRQYTHYYHA